MRRRLVCLGAGGHARSVLDAAEAAGFEVIGVLDREGAAPPVGHSAWPVLGDDRLLPGLIADGVAAVIGLGGAANNLPRRRLFESVDALGAGLPAVVHPRAHLATGVRVGRGTIVLAGAILNTGARAGDDVIVNTAAIVEHDCVLEDHVHVSSGAVLGGAVRVGEASHVGIGAVVREGCSIGARATVGAGAVVVGDVPSGAVWTGVPARPHGR